MLAEVEADVVANRMNDGKCDPEGEVLGRHHGRRPCSGCRDPI